MPFFNANMYFFDLCLKSILKQSLKEIEIIIIDDGSKDYVFDELQKYTKKDSRIRLLRQKHMGSGAARNKGILHSFGEYVVFMDSDDYYPDTQTLEHLYDIVTKSEVKVAGGRVLIEKDEILEAPAWKFKNYLELFKNKVATFRDYQISWGYWCFIYKKDFLINNKLFFPNYLRYQDPPWFVKTLDKAKIFYATEKITYIHREKNSVTTWNNKQIQDYFSGIADLLEYTAKEDLEDLHTFIYRKFLTYDINILKRLSFYFWITKKTLVNKILKVVSKDTVSQTNQEIPVFKDYSDYRRNIKKYDIIDC